MQLTDRAAIVTGGAQGIGKAIALALAKAGADVVIADLNAPAGQDAFQEVHAPGAQAVFEKTDIAQRDEARRLILATVERFGRIDILVKNAGVQHVAPLQDFPE